MVNTKSRNIEKQDHLTTNSQNDRESRIGSNQEKKTAHVIDDMTGSK